MKENLDIASLNQNLNGLTAEKRIEKIHDYFPEGLILSTSFGVQSAVMLHLVSKVIPEIPVIFIDTGYLFRETYLFAKNLTERLNIDLRIYTPLMTAAHQEAIHGKLWEQGKKGLETYSIINKVEPMNRAVKELGAQGWFSGLRRDQAKSRQHLEIIKKQNKILKFHPIIDWSNKDVHQYLSQHDLPYHPLWEQGFVSIGDWHSTRKLEPGMSEEDTRFGGLKRECGLHELSGQADYQI